MPPSSSGDMTIIFPCGDTVALRSGFVLHTILTDLQICGLGPCDDGRRLRSSYAYLLHYPSSHLTHNYIGCDVAIHEHTDT